MRAAGIVVVAAAVAVVLGVQELTAQRSGGRRSYAAGQEVVPAYEGWEQNDDGSFNLVFGTMNRNWEEELHIPIGPHNNIEPGGPDQGQPTYFLPRRNRFLFRIRVPADFGENELVWTLTSPNGETKHAYGTLKPDYYMDNNVRMANNGAGVRGDLYKNTPPALTLDGPRRRTAKVNEPVVLTAVAQDDGLPEARPMSPTDPARPRSLTPQAATGLRLSWFVYRGESDVAFDPPQIKVWEDTRANSNSPWGAGWETPAPPMDNKWVARATFSKPGTYILRCIAHDGGLASYEDITVEVTG